MAYTTIDKPTDYFNTKLYTGNGTAIGSGGLVVTGVGFQPDWVWLKNRTTGDRSHQVYDVIRGVTKGLKTNSDDEENTNTERLTAFGSDGFTVGNNGDVNTSGNAYVSWNWKAGTAFSNDASSTGIGSIDSSGSVNETAGFSIVSYTGSGSAATVKHGLSTTPNMMIIKNRVTSSKDWQVYSPVNDPTDALALNQTDGTGDSDVYWNDTAPTSSVFSVKSGATNTSGAATIGYIFSERKGYSKFGSYVGNGNNGDGPFIYTGFKPAFCLVKRTTSGENWLILDNKRDTFNPQDSSIYPNLANAEDADGADYFDFVSNGMKVKTNNGGTNTDGVKYIYMAFAESPLVTSTGIPTTAR